mmetsp:Transcript_21159/g.19273  ORF Transcript_21159/g.19273 Transcript_21159/m.19273 type:complete len:155 (+) Transcript_21159:234-698(+)
MNPSVSSVNTVYVIPGGGSTNEQGEQGYPKWTEQRTIAAVNHYKESQDKQSSIFLALSAGSLNSPNIKLSDNSNRIQFECMSTMSHLKELLIPHEIIFGDFISWDTVSNGLVLRMFLEGLLDLRKETNVLVVQVFISDFHSERVSETFNWVLGS